MSALPINYAKQSSSPDAIANAVDYAIQVADGFETWFRGNGPEDARRAVRPLEGLRILELGPGETLGAAVLLACGGARVSCADRFVAPWDPEFHAPFYRALREKVRSRGDEYVVAIERLLRANRFAPDVVACYPYSGEELWKIGRRFDVVFSNAVLEHVQDISATTTNLAAVTTEHGYGFHQVDLRDHRDFSRPLEYLTMPRAEYNAIRERTFCEGGCQWRMSTIAKAFAAAGFVARVTPNLFAEPAYLADVRPRLHPEFGAISDEDLAATSALYVVTRKAGGASRVE
jgi:hypothetical protein